jgi:hypothetical protein
MYGKKNCDILHAAMSRNSGVQLTPSNCKLSSLCRGITVTSSISQRNATSDGINPGGKGRAITLNSLQCGRKHLRVVESRVDGSDVRRLWLSMLQIAPNLKGKGV